MPFRPILARPHFAALVAGILCFFPAYLIMTWLAPRIGLVGVLLFLAAQFVGTGLAVAYYARRAPLLHGIVLCTAGALVGDFIGSRRTSGSLAT